MRLQKITIIGNSVAMRTRPIEDSKSPEVYGQILVGLLTSSNVDSVVQLENLSRSRMLSIEVSREVDRYVRCFPDIYLVNLGASDAPPREIPRWYSDVIFGRSGHSICWLLTFVHKALLKPIRPWLVRLRRSRPWVSQTAFVANMRAFLSALSTQTNARIFVIGINPASQRIEDVLPGAAKSLEAYSEVLRELCCQLRITFIDVSDLSSEEFFPDGVHYNQDGHRLIAERLFNALQ